MIPFINWRQIQKDALFIAGVFGLASILLASFLFGNAQMERIDAMSQGPYIIERTDGQQLFVENTDLGWTPDIKYAHRYNTFAQAQVVQSRIGGMIMSVREVVR